MEKNWHLQSWSLCSQSQIPKYADNSTAGVLFTPTVPMVRRSCGAETGDTVQQSTGTWKFMAAHFWQECRAQFLSFWEKSKALILSAKAVERVMPVSLAHCSCCTLQSENWHLFTQDFVWKGVAHSAVSHSLSFLPLYRATWKISECSLYCDRRPSLQNVRVISTLLGWPWYLEAWFLIWSKTYD